MEGYNNDNLVKYKDEMKIEVDNNSGIKALLSTYRDMSIADREKIISFMMTL